VELVARDELREEVCGDADMTALAGERRDIEEGVCEGESAGVGKGR
jgi:hypothetical protein